MKLKNIGSLITCGDHCLGYLMNFAGHGVFSPDGKVEVTPEQAEIHNKLLAEAEIEGLDNRCEVGMAGTFYLGITDGVKAVKTFTGTTVTTDVTVKGKSITFRRHGRVYRGREMKNAECFNFRRIK